MKKLVALLLALVLCLGLVACTVRVGDGEGEGEFIPDNEEAPNNNEQLELYQKYAYLISCLENQDYQSAMWEVESLYNQYMSTAPTEATEDPQLVSRYENAVGYIENFVEYYMDQPQNFGCNINDEYYNGQAALDALYNEFVDLGDFRDSADYAARFSAVEDVMLGYSYIERDQLLNESTGSNNTHRYGADGKLVYLYGVPKELEYIYTTSRSSYYYEYDATGRVSVIRRGSVDRTDALITPTYNDKDQIESIHIITSNGDEYNFTYSYDASGNLIEARKENLNVYDDYTDSYVYHVVYTYNADNQLTEKRYEYLYGRDYVDDEKHEDYTRVDIQTIYTYNYNGKDLVSGTQTYTDWDYNSELVDGKWVYTPYVYRTYTHQYTYACDAQHRMIQEDITYGNYQDKDGNVTDKWNYTSLTRNYNYGNYWFYTPAE